MATPGKSESYTSSEYSHTHTGRPIEQPRRSWSSSSVENEATSPSQPRTEGATEHDALAMKVYKEKMKYPAMTRVQMPVVLQAREAFFTYGAHRGLTCDPYKPEAHQMFEARSLALLVPSLR
ncbi:hypothetical protein P3342_006080 [Pyrenophora teres f. teres]|nr:hypothetical protein P3342_006080 [Pyrenophora teres f. teres]